MGSGGPEPRGHRLWRAPRRRALTLLTYSIFGSVKLPSVSPWAAWTTWTTKAATQRKPSHIPPFSVRRPPNLPNSPSKRWIDSRMRDVSRPHDSTPLLFRPPITDGAALRLATWPTSRIHFPVACSLPKLGLSTSSRCMPVWTGGNLGRGTWDDKRPQCPSHFLRPTVCCPGLELPARRRQRVHAPRSNNPPEPSEPSKVAQCPVRLITHLHPVSESGWPTFQREMPLSQARTTDGSSCAPQCHRGHTCGFSTKGSIVLRQRLENGRVQQIINRLMRRLDHRPKEGLDKKGRKKACLIPSIMTSDLCVWVRTSFIYLPTHRDVGVLQLSELLISNINSWSVTGSIPQPTWRYPSVT